jgi:hypothetical protein
MTEPLHSRTRVPSVSRRGAIIACAGFLTVVALIRVTATYAVFNNTYDEPNHIATGMEWIERGTYTFEPAHPPLARIAVALGPYLADHRLGSQQHIYSGGHEILYGKGSYFRNLALARLGILPFFVLAVAVSWRWASALFGEMTALVSLLLFTTTPTVLAHTGVATTDMPLVGTFLLALSVFVWALERPSIPRGVAFGLASALAVLSKFSAVLFLPACCTAILIARWLTRRRCLSSDTVPPVRISESQVAASALSAFGLIWLTYRFSMGVRLGSLIPGGIPLLAPEFFEGIGAVAFHNAAGHAGYLFGEFRTKGWWYYFPVALMVKAPLPLLTLAIVGMTRAVQKARSACDWRYVAPGIAAAMILTVSLRAHINIGVRHVLPMFPLLAMLAGYGSVRMWNAVRHRGAARAVTAGLVLWQVSSSALAHPDYLAYFNILAGAHPERIILDSDLDWGQDLHRLTQVARERGISPVSVAYWGTADVSKVGPPGAHVLKPGERVTGWVAASEMFVTNTNPDVAGYRWLNAYQPRFRVGRSIKLYYVPR